MNHFPGQRFRTSSSAMTTPKIVFSGTAMMTMRNVSQKACCASAVVSESITGWRPSSNVRYMIIATGAASSRPR